MLGMVGRHGAWLRLPAITIDLPCAMSECARAASQGWVYPARKDGDSVVALVACPDHHYEVELAGQRREADLPGSGSTTPSYVVARERGTWYRQITPEETVAASGAMTCENCSAQADFLSWGVDRGVPDKWYPSVQCREHTEERAVYNFGTLDDPGEYFGVALTWNGMDWGTPLPWPLTGPSPKDIVDQLNLPSPSWARRFGAAGPTR